MKPNVIIAVGALLAGLSVAIGAFGAHALSGTLEANGRADTFETAARYHMYHALALVLLGLVAHAFPDKQLAGVAWSWLIGLFFFCGSLYTLSLTNQTLLGAVAPIGGLAFMIGWGWLAWQFFRG